MRKEIELPDLDLGSAIGEPSPTLDSSLLGNLGVVSDSMAILPGESDAILSHTIRPRPASARRGNIELWTMWVSTAGWRTL